MKKFAAIFLAAALPFSLAACATKGPLTLPPGPAPEPLFGNAKVVKPSPQNPSASDVSTEPKARPQ